MSKNQQVRLPLRLLEQAWAQLYHYYNVPGDGHCETVRETANSILTILRIDGRDRLPGAKFLQKP